MCQTPNFTTMPISVASSKSSLPDRGGSTNNTRSQSVDEIAEFLANEVFTAEPDLEQMQEYAKNLIQAGFLTRDALLENVQYEHVSEWRWMRLYHMDLFEQWIENTKGQNEQ